MPTTPESIGGCLAVGHEPPENETVRETSFIEPLTGKRLTGSVMGAVTLRRDVSKQYGAVPQGGMVDRDGPPLRP